MVQRQGRRKDKTDEANVSFVLKGNRFQITTANASSYAGFRAHFDAEYLLVGKLDAKAEAELTAETKSEGADGGKADAK